LGRAPWSDGLALDDDRAVHADGAESKGALKHRARGSGPREPPCAIEQRFDKRLLLLFRVVPSWEYPKLNVSTP
jgi:hypothetical protein